MWNMSLRSLIGLIEPTQVSLKGSATLVSWFTICSLIHLRLCYCLVTPFFALQQIFSCWSCETVNPTILPYFLNWFILHSSWWLFCDISFLLKLSLLPPYSSLLADDLTSYFPEKVQGLRKELPHCLTKQFTSPLTLCCRLCLPSCGVAQLRPHPPLMQSIRPPAIFFRLCLGCGPSLFCFIMIPSTASSAILKTKLNKTKHSLDPSFSPLTFVAALRIYLQMAY